MRDGLEHARETNSPFQYLLTLLLMNLTTNYERVVKLMMRSRNRLPRGHVLYRILSRYEPHVFPKYHWTRGLLQ